MKSVSKLNKLFPKRSLNVGGRLIDLSEPLIMGILNVTPDSFYDGGRYNTLDKATIRIEKMIEDGVSIIDIGGCSTRPGSEMINLDEEWSRICDVIKICSSKYDNLIISVDTFRSEIAKRSFEEGANIINDISGGSYDDKMFQTISEIKVPYVLMHLRGTPNNMMSKTNYQNLLLNLIEYFDKKTTKLKSYGVNDIIIDPGFGFAKDFDQNYDILKNLNLFNIFLSKLFCKLNCLNSSLLNIIIFLKFISLSIRYFMKFTPKVPVPPVIKSVLLLNIRSNFQYIL